MPDWKRFAPSEFEYDWHNDKLGDHDVAFEEAVQTFYNEYTIRRNKRFSDRYQLVGRTNGGRKLKIIFQLKARNRIRIITGWQI
jgi:uncharacterized DUF497 family protein